MFIFNVFPFSNNSFYCDWKIYFYRCIADGADTECESQAFYELQTKL